MGRRVTAAVGVVAFVDLRDRAAVALAPATEDDPPVHVDVVDAIVPPALVLEWNDPMMQASAGISTIGACTFTARLRVVCVGSRIEPGPGIRAIEQLVAHTVDRLAADPYPWALEGFTAPRPFPIARIDYLAAFVNYAAPTTI
jgi:hypothetical protein